MVFAFAGDSTITRGLAIATHRGPSRAAASSFAAIC
jgi:hypothetical protein